MDNPSFMLNAIFERKKEIDELINKNEDKKWFNVDPFYLLKEAAEMSNLINLTKNENLMTTE